MADILFFKTDILPQMEQRQLFGENVEIISIKEKLSPLAFQVMSTVLFVELEMKVRGVHEKVPLVCKFSSVDPELREKLQLDSQFFNENLVYQHIVPLMPNVISIIPKFYFGQSGNELAYKNCIIVENLTHRGFKIHTNLYFDFEHCLLVFKKLGQFHGGSLYLKATHHQVFLENIKQLREQRWLEKRKEEFNYAYKKYAMRGITPLLDKEESREILNKFINQISDIYCIILEMFTDNEMSVLCHGDFTGNNMMFKYEDSKPVDVHFFDFATAKFTSPIIDISFFLFLNTSPDLRRKHFRQDFLNIYLDGVKSVAGTLAPTIDQLWAEFQQNGVYGYFIVAFFLPLMTDPKPGVGKLSLEERVKLNLMRGGDKVTDTLVEIVRDLISWECLK